MDEGADVSRRALAQQVARRLIYLPSLEFPELSAVQAAKRKLDNLLDTKEIPDSEHRQFFQVLNSLEGCDMDRCDRVGGLALEVARSLTLWREAFPDAELERLLALM